MAAGVYDLKIEQGATFNRLLTWTQDGAPVPLTGLSARLQVRKSVSAPDPPLLTLTSDNGGITLTDPGQILLSLSAAATTVLAFSSAVYDLEIVSPTTPETVMRLLQGKVTVSPEVTR